MHSNGMRLLKLINDLLDLVRMESGRMEVKREPLELTDFIKGLASAARQVADDKRIKLETWVASELGAVLADRDKLEKILLNLLFNALKFTPAGGRVDLRAEKKGDDLVLLVKDTGMGISPKDLPYVFDRFWQADGSARRKYQGVGIGLSLVKELTEIQGGKVSVESEEGKGTTFTVQFPFAKVEPKPESRPAQTIEEPAKSDEEEVPATGTVTSEEWLSNLYRRAELFPALTPVQEAVRPVETTGARNRPTALIADDEPDMLRFLKSQLGQHYNVLEAVDGQQVAFGRRQRLSVEAVFNDRTARPGQEPDRVVSIATQARPAEPASRIHHRSTQRHRSAAGAGGKARLARPHERGHHPRDQQPA